MTSIEFLDASNAAAYEAFVSSHAEALLYYSLNYQELLKRFLGEEPCYFVARNGEGEVLAVLPAFLKKSERHGAVLNSLPFYGSHGSILGGDRELKRDLLKAFYRHARENGCASATVITSPFESELGFYESEAERTFRDQRIGMLTPLPAGGFDASEKLMAIYHSKTRNMVRKARKLPIEVVTDGPDRYHDFLVQTHAENMAGIGGIPKPARFFDLVREVFPYGSGYRIYTALLDGQPIAALLLLYYNKIVEYFTPVIKEEFRSMQPLSLLIHAAMCDAVGEGFRWWNWGGTWLTQDGVYHFKKRWGTEDFPYFYYTRVYDESLLYLDRRTLLAEYPYFFAVPFGELKNAAS